MFNLKRITMILENQKATFGSDYDSESFVNVRQITELWMKDQLKEDLFELYSLQNKVSEPIKIGNSKSLIAALNYLDSQCEKIDIDTEVRNVYLDKMLDNEKAIFDILGINDEFILNKNKSSDLLKTETA